MNSTSSMANRRYYLSLENYILKALAAGFDFVSTEIRSCFCLHSVNPLGWAILPQRQLVGRVLGVFSTVVMPAPASFAY